MKKIFALLFCTIFLVSIAYAERMPTPRPFTTFYMYDGEPVEGLTVTFTVQDKTVTKVTNEKGGITVDLDLGYSPDFPDSEYKDMSSIDNVEISVKCGFDVCDKTYRIGTLGYTTNYILSEKPTDLVIPEPEPTPEPTPECKDCPSCESCVECEDCIDTECPSPINSDNIGAIIAALLGTLLLGGAGGVYFTRNQTIGLNGGLKVYRGTDGKEKTLHKHPGILGYHDPYTQHRETKERHPRGQLMPHYKRDESGEWEYVG